MTHKPPQGIDAPNCAHKQLKKQMVGEFVYYVCECGQKFRVEPWDGKVTVREPGADTVENNRNDTMEYWRSRAITAEQKVLEFHAQIAQDAPPDPRKDLALEEQLKEAKWWHKRKEYLLEHDCRLTREPGYSKGTTEECQRIAELEQRLAEMRGAKR